MKNKKMITSIVIGIVVLIIIATVVISILLARKDLNTFSVKKENMYVYFGSERFDVKGNITLNHDGDVTDIKIDGKKTTLYGEPLYYAKGNKLILPVNYNFVFYKTGVQKKVPFFTKLEKKYGDYYLDNKDLKYKVNNGFLFDGSDYYIFLSNVKVSFGGKNIDISPMSFVNYVYDTKDLFIYNYKTGKMSSYQNVNGDVLVNNNEFKVNLSSDIIIINNKEKLLMKNFDYLKKLK